MLGVARQLGFSRPYGTEGLKPRIGLSIRDHDPRPECRNSIRLYNVVYYSTANH